MMMSDHKTVVWIKKGVVSKALGQGSSPASKQGEHWPWIRAVVLSGDVSGQGSADAVLNLLITEEDSEFSDERVELPASAYREKSPALFIVNQWAEDEASVPPDDLISLTHLHAPAVVHCLKKRYQHNIIYTATGPILIALNPFKELPGLYDDDMMGRYWKKGEKVDDALELKPHVYATADEAFRGMMRALRYGGDLVKDQSILVSGESGAGKTVSTKHIMKYLATLSQRKVEHAKRRRAPSPGRKENTALPRSAPRPLSRRISRTQSWKKGALVEEKILQSNPILESFGNARTVRNDNSSRFGKFIELQFKRTGSLIGAAIDTYLLEKVRLIHVGSGERTFHVFYELLASATEEERKMFLLGAYEAQDFNLTSSSGIYARRDGTDDSQLFENLVTAMGTMGLEPSTQEDIFAVCVAFLHASNLKFEAVTDDACKVDESNPHLQPVLKLLGLEKDAFQDALCQFEIEAGNASYTRRLNKALAVKGLDALVKATYGAMFSFIVQSINKNIAYKPKRGDPHELGKAAFIGVLDIFGFEYFEHNSFEQLCINYCNEALQQQFNRYVFKTEQEEYQKEGIAWDFIVFPDNQDVIELIDKKGTGIISLLTDQCRTPRSTDKLFAGAVYKACGGHHRFEASDLQQAQRQFIVHHYAGPVMYEVEGFLEKNRDEIPRGATNLLESSTKSFVQLLGKISSVSLLANSLPTTSSGVKGSWSKRPTVGGQFAAQLAALRRRIDSTDPHYIRCIKPNQRLMHDDFDNVMVADQLRYAGVLEAIRVSRVGYPQRYSHELLLQRYHFLASEAIRGGGVEKQIEILVDAIAKKIWAADNPNEALPAGLLAAVGIQKGETKIFLRQAAFDFMESFRTKQLSVTATRIERAVRGFLARRRCAHIVDKIVFSQACLRRFLARKYIRAIRELRAATKIQSIHRMSVVRGHYLKKRRVALWCQKIQRSREAIFLCAILREKHHKERAVAAHQYNSVVTIQKMYRGKVARDLFVVRKHRKMEADKARGAEFTEEQKMYRKVEKEQQKVTIAAVRAAAVAKETAYSKDKEVDSLRKDLAETQALLQQTEALKVELIETTAELESVKSELSSAKLSEEKALSQIAVLEAENHRLKQQIGAGGLPGPVGYYKSVRFQEFSDLRQVDERITGIVNRSQQGRNDLRALVQSLAILK